MSFFKLVTLLTVGLALADEKSDVMTARCRAQCLNRFAAIGYEKNCLGDSECWMCWDTCNMFYSNFKVWGHMCTAKDICFPGCRESCKFYHSHHSPTSDVAHTSARFLSLNHQFDPSTDTIHFEWSTPKGHSLTDSLVYVFMMYDQLAFNWHQMEQAFHTNITVRRGLLKTSSKVLLAAYDTNGKVAEIEMPSSEIAAGYDDRDFDEMSLRDEQYILGKEHIHSRKDIVLNSWTPVLTSLKYSTNNLGAVEALISWQNIGEIVEKYEIQCKLANDQMDSAAYLRRSNTLATVTLWPNNIYQIVLKAYTSGSKRAIAQSPILIIDTSLNVSGTNPLQCSQCISFEYLITFLLILTAIILITFIGYFLTTRSSFKRQVNDNDI